MHHTPVIIGVGEITDRPTDPLHGLEPAALMVHALRAAEADAGTALLHELDSLDVVNEISWPYHDPIGRVAALLGVRPARAVYGEVGGQTPVRGLHDAALRIARGESTVAAVCGAEAASTVAKAARAGVALAWPDLDAGFVPVRSGSYQNAAAQRLGVAIPAHVYPLYENAALQAWGQRPDEAHAESARLWAGLSAVAAGREAAWLGRAVPAGEIATASAANRRLAWPYVKLMVANPAVNQGAAVLLCSLERARAAGVPEARLVHLWGGAAAAEPRDVMARDGFTRSTAMEAVLRRGLAAAGVEPAGLDAVELYSCFPVVPKMARRVLGLGAEAAVTVAGGLTFFGAPLNDYMGHAAVAMVQRLRGGGGAGLLYGQGGYVTSHHALVLGGRARADGAALAQQYDVQGEADRARGAVPRFVAEHAGPAEVETFTVLHDREGAATHGVVVGRTEDGARLLARVAPEDGAAMARLLDPARSPVGERGMVRMADGVAAWSLA